MKRGDIYLMNLGAGIGSEQGNERPCLVIQNDIGNRFSPTTIIVPLTSKRAGRKLLPTHVQIDKENFVDSKFSIDKTSIALCEQIRTVSKTERIVPINGKSGYIGTIKKEKMEEISKALRISLGLE